MNCNEEFVVKALGKLTLEFNYNWDEQKKIRELFRGDFKELHIYFKEVFRLCNKASINNN